MVWGEGVDGPVRPGHDGFYGWGRKSWMPAFAGMTGTRKMDCFARARNDGGRARGWLSGEEGVDGPVEPGHDGFYGWGRKSWMPAFAGMTEGNKEDGLLRRGSQ